MNFEALLAETETALRAGNRDLARTGLLKIKGKAVPRSKARHFATLARRAGLLNLALQIMLPIVRPKTTLGKRASAEEISTYALVLLGFGAIQECSALLSSAQDQSNPDILMAHAFAAIKTWDYAKATLYLEQYIKSEVPNDYLKTVAKVNLAASQIALGGEAHLAIGHRLLIELQEKTSREGWTLLNSNAIELSIQLAVQNRDWLACDELFSRANASELFTQKWRAISEVLRNQGNRDGLLQLKKVRELAVEQGHWETVRDCDFHQSIATKNNDLALHVYFGTPFPTYRKRLRDSTIAWLEIPELYRHPLSLNVNSGPTRVFQLAIGREIENQSVALPIGKSLHTALQILASDFYRPFSIGTLFSESFKEEYFNPESSPRRVAFLIHRLRNWFEEHSVPIDISSDRDGYRLLGIEPYEIELSAQPATTKSTNQGSFELLRLYFEKQKAVDLSAREIANALGTSERSARYFLKWAIDNGLLFRIGTGRQIRYKL